MGSDVGSWQDELLSDANVGVTWMWSNEHFGIDRIGYLPLKMAEPLPPFRVEMLEEDGRYEVMRHADGHVRRALKLGVAHGPRASMDRML